MTGQRIEGLLCVYVEKHAVCSGSDGWMGRPGNRNFKFDYIRLGWTLYKF